VQEYYIQTTHTTLSTIISTTICANFKQQDTF